MPYPPSTRSDALSAGQQRAAIAAILALHVAAGWAVLQVQAVREPLRELAPMFVDLLSPPHPVDPPPPPRRQPPPRPAALPPVVATTPQPQSPPPPFDIKAPDPLSAPMVPTVAEAPPPIAAPAPPAPPPALAAPRLIPPSAIQYLVWPDITYPSASRRLGESGLAVVAVHIDADGLPREVQVVQSSGFERLDRAAVAGVRLARFKPYMENGRALAGWARIPVPFELEK